MQNIKVGRHHSGKTKAERVEEGFSRKLRSGQVQLRIWAEPWVRDALHDYREKNGYDNLGQALGSFFKKDENSA